MGDFIHDHDSIWVVIGKTIGIALLSIVVILTLLDGIGMMLAFWPLALLTAIIWGLWALFRTIFPKKSPVIR